MSGNRKFPMTLDQTNGAANAYELYQLPDDAHLVAHGHVVEDAKEQKLHDAKDQPARTKKITHTYKDTPKNYPFKLHEAYRIRILCLANAALYAIEHDPEARNPANPTYVSKRGEIIRLVDRKLNELEHLDKQRTDFDAELAHFYHHELPAASGLSTKSLELAEGFYVWQKLTPPVRETQYKTASGLQVTLRETPRNAKLTDAQTAEFYKIRRNPPFKKPEWFTALPKWAQTIILSLSPLSNSSRLEKSRPAMLRHIPGEATATKHELIIRNAAGDVLSHTTTFRQGAPSSYKMKDKQECQQSAQDNLGQVLNAEVKNAEEAFEATWGFAPTEKFPCPLLLSGLLTSSEQAGIKSKIGDALGITGDDNNSRMTHEKSAAVEQCRAQHLNMMFFDLNVAINKQRKGDATPDEAFHNQILLFCNTMRTKIRETKSVDLQTRSEREARLTHLVAILGHIDNLRDRPSLSGRNKNLMLAAAYNVAARLMSGLSIGNCKSSKDRLNFQLIAADALLIDYFDQKNSGAEAVFSPHNATDTPRKNYIARFTELFASGHYFWTGHDSSPGCLGMKDEGILDKDIITVLKDDAYRPSVRAANFNKPGSFWEKHGATVKKYVMYGIAGIALLVFGGCVLSGVLSPIGLTGIPATLGLTFAGLKAKDKYESKKAEKRNATVQIAVAQGPQNAASTQTISTGNGNSYAGMPWTPSTQHGNNPASAQPQQAPASPTTQFAFSKKPTPAKDGEQINIKAV